MGPERIYRAKGVPRPPGQIAVGPPDAGPSWLFQPPDTRIPTSSYSPDSVFQNFKNQTAPKTFPKLKHLALECHMASILLLLIGCWHQFANEFRDLLKAYLLQRFSSESSVFCSHGFLIVFFILLSCFFRCPPGLHLSIFIFVS